MCLRSTWHCLVVQLSLNPLHTAQHCLVVLLLLSVDWDVVADDGVDQIIANCLSEKAHTVITLVMYSGPCS